MTKPREFLLKLTRNLQILKEREAKYGSFAAPLSLTTQIEDYQKAIELTQQAIEQNISSEELQAEFVDLNLEIRDQVQFEPAHKKFTGQNPYRGLKKFTEEDAQFFFGRAAASEELLSIARQIIESKTNSKNPALLMVVGASGSGKSSLVRAGLIPKLRQGALPDSEHWPIRVMVPGHSPLDALSAQFKGLLERGAPLLRAELDSGPKAFHLLLREALSDQPDKLYYTLVIDQFEELFTQCESEQERRAFIDLILYEAHQRDHRGLTIVTMRADFYGRALAYKSLAEAITAHQFAVSPMTGPELREAILLPAEAVGLEMERGLALALVQDTAKEPGRLPLLQHALLELFNRRTKDNVMTLVAYNEIGGVQGALTHRADEVLKQLTPEQQRLARRIFVELTELGEGISDTRRRVSRNQLDYLGDPTQIETVLQQLSGQEARLVVSGAEVEVTHEALIQQWGQLRDWLDEDRESVRLHRRLNAAAREWQAKNQDEAYLYTGSLLAQAEVWAETADNLSPPERAFLQASLERRDRAAREREAQRQRELEQQRQRAEEQAEAAAQLRKRAWIAAGIGVVAVIAAIVAVFFSWQANASFKEAEAQRAEADSARGTAQAQATRALNAEETAEAETTRAVEAQKEAERRADIALAQSLVSSALLAEDDDNLRTLLAIEAVNINPDNEKSTQRVLNDAIRGQVSKQYFSSVLPGPAHPVTSVSISPDGSTLAFTGNVSDILLWDLTNIANPPIAIERRQENNGDVPNYDFLAFSPDGNSIAASASNKVFLWNLDDLEADPIVLRGYTNSIGGLVFNPVNDNMLAFADYNGNIFLWNLDSLDTDPIVLEGDNLTDPLLAFNPAGDILAYVGNLEIWLWDLKDLDAEPKILTGGQFVTFSPDGNTLATGNYDSVLLWDLNDIDANPETLIGHESEINDAAFSPDGRILISGDSNGDLLVWDLFGHPVNGSTLINSVIATLKGNQFSVGSVAFSPNGRMFVSAGGNTTGEGGEDNAIRLWDLTDSDPEPLIHQTDEFESLALSPDGHTVALGGSPSSWAVRLLDLTDPDAGTLPLIGHDDVVFSIVFDPLGKFLASAGGSGPSFERAIRLWNLDDLHTEPITLSGPYGEGAVWPVTFSPDGQKLASASSDNNILLWNMNNLETGPQRLEGYSSGVGSVAFSPDGKFFAAGGSEEASLQIWNLADPESKPTILESHKDQVRSVTFSPVGGMLASAGGDPNAADGGDNAIRLWNLKSLNAGPEILQGQAGTIYTLAFSLDGKILASGSSDSTIVLWDLNNLNAQPQRLQGHEGAVNSVIFHSDRETLISGSADHTIRLWSITLDKLVELGCQRLRRNLTQEEWSRYLPGKEYRATCPNLPLEAE